MLAVRAGTIGFGRAEEPSGVHAEGLGAAQRAARGVHRTGTTCGHMDRTINKAELIVLRKQISREEQTHFFF